jgi:tetratricopeptide (TPR) repeat protein
MSLKALLSFLLLAYRRLSANIQNQGASATVIKDPEIFLALTYRRLSANIQKKWRILAIFPGSFDISAAAYVWDSKSETAKDLLSKLVQYSLLCYVPQQRRYFIQTWARSYADTRLEPEERDQALLKYSKHYLNVLRMLNGLYLGGEDGEGIAVKLEEWSELFPRTDAAIGASILLSREWINIRTAQNWVAARMLESESYAELCNDYPIAGNSILQLQITGREILRWVEEGLTAARFLRDEAAESRLLSNLGLTYANLGDIKLAIEAYEQALNKAQVVGALGVEQSILRGLGECYANFGEIRKAIDFYERALVIARNIGDHRSEQFILGGLGDAYIKIDEFQKAIEFFEQRLLIARRIVVRPEEISTLSYLGRAYSALGDLRRAIDYYEQGLILSRELGDKLNEESALGNLGNAYALRGENQKALVVYAQALTISQQLKDVVSESAYLGNLGVIYANVGKHKEAIDLYQKRLRIAREIGDRRGEGNALGNIGNAYLNLDQTKRAIEYYEQARFIAREISDRIGEATVSGGLGNAYIELGDAEKASKHFEKQVSIVRELGDTYQEGLALMNLGVAASRLRELDRATVLLQQALSIIRKNGDLFSEGNVLWELSEAWRMSDKHLQAADATLEALKIYERINSSNAAKALSTFLAYLDHPETEVRQFAVGALAERVVDDPNIRGKLVQYLRDPDWHVRNLVVDALGPFAVDDPQIRKALLAQIDDENAEVRQQLIKYLSSLVATDLDVRAAVFPYISRLAYEKPSLDIIARDFFSAAGFEVRAREKPFEFICYPVADLWKLKIGTPIYTYCLIGRPLDRDIVMKLYDSAKAIIGMPKIIFVVIDQTPEEGGLIEVGALRAAEDVQVIPLDDAILQQGRELQKEQEKLREYLLRFFGHRNLYDVRNPVVDRLNFFGRETRAYELLEILSQGTPLALLGLRKMGKSSLVQHLRDNSPFTVAYVDLQAGEELSALYNRTLGSWQRSLRVHLPSFDWIPPRISADPSSSFGTATQELMTRLEVSGHSSQLGLFIDEIEIIVPRLHHSLGTVNSEELNRYLAFARALRGIVQETNRLSLLLIGVDPQFNRISRWLGQQNPFYQFFREEYLGPLSREDCIQMIRHIGRQMELEYTDEAAQFIADVSGGHPFLARQLCSATIETMGEHSITKITLDLVLKAAELFIRRPGTADLLNENGLWGEISDPVLWPKIQVAENQDILRHLARAEPQPEATLLARSADKTTSERSLFELEHRAVLGRLEQQLKIRFGLFRHWIEKYQSIVE